MSAICLIDYAIVSRRYATEASFNTRFRGLKPTATFTAPLRGERIRTHA